MGELEASPLPVNIQLNETTDMANCSKMLHSTWYLKSEVMKHQFIFCKPHVAP
jgi:hypothetical protein